MYRPLTLILATAFAAPALWLGFVDHSLPIQVALTRYLIAVPTVAIMLVMFRSIIRDYGKPIRQEPDHPLRRAEDLAGDGNTVEGEVIRGTTTRADGPPAPVPPSSIPGAGSTAVTGGSPAAEIEQATQR